MTLLPLPLPLLLLAACASTPDAPEGVDDASAAHATEHHVAAKADPEARFGRAAPAPEAGQAVAIFAGGCFWCMEKPFDAVDGVIATTSGYTDGPEIAPTYDEVSAHRTGHTEALRVLYDPARVSYARLLDVFWHNVDPTQADGQFCDHGEQYRTGIYTSDPAEQALARASMAAVAEKLGAPVVTEIDPASPFWPAEDYHQDFYEKNPEHYLRYRTGCGRDRRLQQLWGDAAVVGAGADWIEALQDGSGDAMETLPTPYTAEQIAQAMPVGTRIQLQVRTAEGTVTEDWLVTAATDEACTIRSTTRAADGTVVQGPEEGTDTWTSLRDHAAFPAAATTQEEITVQAFGRAYPGWRYTVRSTDEAGVETVRTFDFARDLAGPPVLMTVTVGGQEVMRMEQIERSMAG